MVARARVINHLKALIVSAPEDLRAELRDMTSDKRSQLNEKLLMTHSSVIEAVVAAAHPTG